MFYQKTARHESQRIKIMKYLFIHHICHHIALLTLTESQSLFVPSSGLYLRSVLSDKNWDELFFPQTALDSSLIFIEKQQIGSAAAPPLLSIYTLQCQPAAYLTALWVAKSHTKCQFSSEEKEGKIITENINIELIDRKASLNIHTSWRNHCCLVRESPLFCLQRIINWLSDSVGRAIEPLFTDDQHNYVSLSRLFFLSLLWFIYAFHSHFIKPHLFLTKNYY